MSGFQGAVEDGPVEIKLTSDSLQWSEPKTSVKKSINISAVICVLPAPAWRKFEFHILFLDSFPQENAESTDGNHRLGSLYASNLPSAFLGEYLFLGLPTHLKVSSTSQDANLHVIVSLFSGTRRAKGFFHNVLRPLLSHLQLENYRVHETDSEQTIIEIARSILYPRAKRGIQQTVLLLSGDGGLIDIIRGFFSKRNDNDDDIASCAEQPTVALIPQGTGNALANSTGILSRASFGLDVLLRGVPQPLPTFTANFSPGACFVVNGGDGREEIPKSSSRGHYPQVSGAVVVSWGMHATLVADSDTTAYRKFGTDRFKMVAHELLYPPDGSPTHRYQGIIKVTTRPQSKVDTHQKVLQSTEHMYVLITMVSTLEKGFTVSPASVPLDGQLRLIHFEPIPPQDAMDLMGLAYQNGRHVQSDLVSYEAIESIRIDLKEADERWRRFCVDGQIVVVEEDGWVEVHRSTDRFFKLIVPRT